LERAFISSNWRRAQTNIWRTLPRERGGCITEPAQLISTNSFEEGIAIPLSGRAVELVPAMPVAARPHYTASAQSFHAVSAGRGGGGLSIAWAALEAIAVNVAKGIRGPSR
jgi:hypothetical protein